MKSAFENLGNRGVPGSDEEFFLKEKEALRIGMSFFIEQTGEGKPYSRDEIFGNGIKGDDHEEGIIERVAKARAKRDWNQAGLESELAEVVMALMPHEFGWLKKEGSGVRNYSVVTEEGDDFFFNHVDGVKEICFKSEGKIIRWSEDVTRHHPDNDYEGDEKAANDSFSEIYKKVFSIVDRVRDGESPGEVHFFSSVAGEEDLHTFLVGPRPMPKAVISVPSSVARQLRSLYFKSLRGDESARDALTNHPFREEYLAQIKTAMEAQIRLAGEVLASEPVKEKRARLIELSAQAREVLEYIESLMKDKDTGTKNGWLKSAYRTKVGIAA